MTSNIEKIIRVGVNGYNWCIKIKTQGTYAHGWKIMIGGFVTREAAVIELRRLIETGEYIEG